MMSEYERLTAEILAREAEIVQYHSILYTATAAILVFAFEKGNYLYFLLPYVVIVPLQLLTEMARRNNCRVYAYISVFLEGKEYLHERRFEKYHVAVRKHDGAVLSIIKQMKYRFQYFLVLILCALLSIHEVIVGEHKQKALLVVFVSVIMITAIILMAVNLTDYVKTTKTFILRWQTVKAAEEEAQQRKNNRNPE